MACSDKACEKRITEKLKEHETTLYGKDNLSGLSKLPICLKSKVSNAKFYTTIASVLVGLFLFATPFIHRSMDAFSEEKEKISECKADNKVIQVQIETLVKEITEIKENVKEIKKRQLTKDEMIAIVREAVGE